MNNSDAPLEIARKEMNAFSQQDGVLVAIDTSSGMGSLALFQSGQMLAEYTWHVGQNHTAETLPALDHLMESVRRRGESVRRGKTAHGPAETESKVAVRGVIVALGPGSFNGLRAGISLAKGLAFAANVPIVGVGTLEVSAYGQSATDRPICALQNAGRGEVAAAVYQMVQRSWTEKMAPQILPLHELLGQLEPPIFFCGELTPEHVAEIDSRLGDLARVASPAASVRRAGWLAELGLRRLEAGEADDVATLQPIYLRRPPITRSKRSLRQGA